MEKSIDLTKAMSYDEYFGLMEELAKTGKTTGTEKLEERIFFTKLNYQRSKRIGKTLKINDSNVALINTIQNKIKWMVIAEPWCGDAANIVPVIAGLADLSPNIDLEIILRDENLEIMDRYLTNGGRAIPILVAFDDKGKELGTWGPRPAILQQLVAAEKKTPTMTSEEMKERIQIWYTKDKGQSIVDDITNRLQDWQLNPGNPI